ncbi:class I SAM-dependent methyltransferase [Lichenihabitans sp. PAMC28606]|uniref:class I SAM-dependent methyltransferase n=1 Tax=Lichenihabitans sp. PAMC28606 TaxID=2880932 RepID=UPI001D09FF40|nr:methyltransferase domain-containing protein [Lichenihabitans sp. PAMC28606]UDL93227.1 class I SAM-dependent methyltransferase [Lichenihabitans sp. PAMC28606]
MALVLDETMPDWRFVHIHESSPSDRGISKKLKESAKYYTASQFFPGKPFGIDVDGFRNEDLESQTFDDASFDIVVSLDVMEHVFNPSAVYQEVYRTLKHGGVYLHTFPMYKYLSEGATRRAEISSGGEVRHLIEPPQYHLNPVDSRGSLVTFDYGYDITRLINEWAPFDVRISRFWDESHGIIGEHTEVVICRKPAFKFA